MNMKWITAAGLTTSTVVYIVPVNGMETASFQDIKAYSDMGNAIEVLAARGNIEEHMAFANCIF